MNASQAVSLAHFNGHETWSTVDSRYLDFGYLE